MVNGSKEDIIYAAGFFDGEGCICITNKSLSINVGNTVREPLEFLKQTFGGVIYEYQPKMNRAKVMNRWYIYGEDMIVFLKSILPYLRVKTKHSLLGIEFVTTPHTDDNRRNAITEELRELNKRGVSVEVAESNRKKRLSKGRIDCNDLFKMMEDNPICQN